jgi:D-alanyl-D-alanine carboxypeptidase
MDAQEYEPKRASKGRTRRLGKGSVLLVIALVAAAAIAVACWRIQPQQGVGGGSSSEAAVSSLEGSTSAFASTSAEVDLPTQSEADRSAEDQPAGAPETETPDAEEEETLDLLMLVNATHPLPEGYDIALTQLSNGQQVATAIYPALQRMFDDARGQGIYPVVASGFRTAEKQQSLMDEKIQSFLAQGYTQEDAEAEALKWVNAVGCSEHQSGLAVDINADGIHSTGSEVYAWLAENAWRYGFVLRYPEDKTELTGTSYEPWHYRYVGTEAAAEIYNQGVCLEEYVEN